MALKDEIRSSIRAALGDMMDNPMNDRGFYRSTRGLIYKRSIGRSEQRIEIQFSVHPRDNPSAAAAVYPMMEILIPDVDVMLRRMLSGDPALPEGITGGTSRQPIGFTSEKLHDGRWYLYQPDSVPGVVDEIWSFVARWTMPLLDTYTTVEEVISAYERNDGRLARDRAQALRVVAALLACGRIEYAKETMEKHFGAAGLRSRYQKVFDFVWQSV